MRDFARSVSSRATSARATAASASAALRLASARSWVARAASSTWAEEMPFFSRASARSRASAVSATVAAAVAIRASAAASEALARSSWALIFTVSSSASTSPFRTGLLLSTLTARITPDISLETSTWVVGTTRPVAWTVMVIATFATFAVS